MDAFDQFIKSKTGIGIDTDGYYGFQCMDLMHEYLRTVLKLQDLRVLAAADAKSVFQNFSGVFGHELFELILNTPTNVPQKGDIMFYKEPYGRYVDNGVVKYAGHVDVFVEGNAANYRAFSQNIVSPNSPQGLPAVINHPNYDGVLGWLRYKGSVPQLSTNGGLPANYGDIVAGSTNWDEVKKLGFMSIAALKLELDNLRKRPQSCPAPRDLTAIKQEIINAANKL
jgi:hypothetical protein